MQANYIAQVICLQKAGNQKQLCMYLMNSFSTQKQFYNICMFE